MRFEVRGEVIPKERPRKGQHGNFYTPRNTKAYEELIAYSAMAAGKMIKSGPVVFTAWIYTSNKRLDADNALKSLLDGCNRHAFHDDQQVSEVHLYRIWSDRPRVVVEIEATDERTE